jgi:putative flippase GtrA
MHYAIAGVVAIVFGASFNFTGHKLWTFPSSSSGDDEAAA